ncbi:MAG: glycosyltransferase family 2 protein [Bacteroidetes bacterium]|nr:MAG: glycosyltransferase family 2 protein [Bacteroidota bacterium]
MNNLSVAIITFNEEKNIERCLNSVKNIADEILVVDSFSTDNTEDICKKFNVNFIKNKFSGHIQQKEFAKNTAKYDYVLSLDADELLDEELIHSIKLIKSNLTFDGYEMNRLNNYCGKWIKHGSWYPDKKIRLVNKHKASWQGKNPHDSLKLINRTSPGKLKGNILHFSYSSIEEHINQTNKFTTISAEVLFKEEKSINFFKIFLSTFGSFFKGFFLKLAFLDGFYGITICLINTFATWLKYTKLRQLIKDSK